MVPEVALNSVVDASPNIESVGRGVDVEMVIVEVPVIVFGSVKKVTWFAVGVPDVATPPLEAPVAVTYLLPP